ncbi:hypothetical protein EBR25_14275 [bacterium]|jgi:hypothetical protein|nr:hypothetical protein [bacterium]
MLPRERKTADRRVLARVLQLSFGKKDPEDEMLDFISELYARMGGSWVAFFQGDPDQVRLLKKCAAVVVKKDKELEKQDE